MSAYILWMDHNEAKVYHLEPSGNERRQMKLHTHKHAIHPHGKKEGHHHPEDEKWFHELSDVLKGANEVLVMGPGEAKKLFKSYLERKHASTLGKAIVGIETVDHPTEGQLLAKARDYFKKYDLFH